MTLTQTSRGGERAATRAAATPAPRTLRHLLVAFDPSSPYHPRDEHEAVALDRKHRGGPWMRCECPPEVA